MLSKGRNVCFVLLGVLGLLLRDRYAGPGMELVHSFGGNFAVSFAVYFMFLNAPLHPRFRRLEAAALAFTCVNLFEATDGFGFMSNTYDPFDYLANTAGILFAVLVDVAIGRLMRRE